MVTILSLNSTSMKIFFLTFMIIIIGLNNYRPSRIIFCVQLYPLQRSTLHLLYTNNLQTFLKINILLQVTSCNVLELNFNMNIHS